MKKITFLLLTLLFFVPNVWSQCESAIALTPGTDQSGDTSSFDELFSDTCLGYYDNGYDGLFSYTANEEGESLSISLTSSDSYTGVSISEGCPSGGGSCIVSDTYGTSFSLDSGPLTAGVTYYVHFSTWSPPYAIQYTLTSTINPPANCPTAAISSFPYSFGFENLDCWTNSASSAAWAIGQGDDYGPDSVTEGANSVFFNDYDYSSGSTGDLMSPDFDFGALTTARVSFDYWDSSGSDVVKVLVDDGSGPVVVYTTESVVSTWTTINVDLPQYANQTVKIGFRGTSVYGSTNPHIDNFMISEAPSCLEPSALSAASITATSAEISWTSDDSSFNIEVVDVTAGGTATGTATNTGVTSPYPLTGLSSNNEYEVYVQTDCGAGETSAWAGPVSFTTLCEAFDVPYTENFDSTSTGTSSSPTVPNCWSFIDGGSGYGYVSSSGANSFYFYNYSDMSGDYILVSPETNALSSGTNRVSFDVDGSMSQALIVGTLSDPADSSTFTAIETITLATNNYESYVVNIPAGTDSYIGFKHGQTGLYDSYYLDNITVEPIPSCLEPTAVSAASITATSAEISWTSDDSSFNVEVVDVTAGGTATGTATNSGVTSPYSLSGLDSNTEYEVYVQTDCGSGDTSPWAGPVSFTTACDAISSFPWTEDFESVTTPALPSCFSELNNNSDTDYWKTYSSYGTSSSKAAGMFTDYNAGNNDDYLILPQFTLTGNERLKYSVRAHSSGEPNDYKVVLSTTGNSAADFTTDLMALTTVSSTSHEENIISLSAYSGDVYIAIHIPSGGLDGWYIYFDDFTVEALPSCSAPTAITSSSITTSSAELSWIAGDSETLWNIEVVDVTAGGTATGTATYAGVTNPYSLTGLSSNNDYEVYVQADCGAGDTSAWAGPVSFTTEPAPIVPNYANDFSTFPGEFWSQGIGALNAGPAGSTSQWTSEVFGNSGDSGAAYVNVYYSSFSGGNLDWLISPMFDLSSGNHYLNFNVALTGFFSTNSTTFAADDFVTLMVSEDNGSTWSELYRWDSNNSPSASGDAIPEIDLSSYTSMTKFAFYAESNAGNIDNDFFIDDFQITTTSLGIEEASVSQFTYFPNPVNDVLTIKAQKVVEDITVFNMLGQVVKRQTPNTRDCTVDLSAMQTGAYFVQVSIGNTVETVRILKN